MIYSSLHLASAEGPRLHHGEVGKNAVHSVKREAVCASGDVCIYISMGGERSKTKPCISKIGR